MFKTIILQWGTSNLPEHLLTQHPINYKSKASSKKQATLDLLSKPWHCSEARAKDRIRGMLVLVSCALCTQINHEGVNKGRMAKKILLSSQLSFTSALLRTAPTRHTTSKGTLSCLELTTIE